MVLISFAQPAMKKPWGFAEKQGRAQVPLLRENAECQSVPAGYRAYKVQLLENNEKVKEKIILGADQTDLRASLMHAKPAANKFLPRDVSAKAGGPRHAQGQGLGT